MNQRIFYVICLLCLTSAGLMADTKGHSESEADLYGQFWERKRKLQDWYRAQYANTLKQVDRVEIYLLDFNADESRGFRKFPVGNKYTSILKQKTLTGTTVVKMRDAVIMLLKQGDNNGGGLCHYPIHGIRLYQGDSLIYSTSFCWKCNNYYFRYPDQSQKSVVGMRAPQIEKLMKQMLPIPKSELDRFNSALGRKPVSKQAEQVETDKHVAPESELPE